MLLFKKIPKGMKIKKKYLNWSNILREINPGTKIAIYILIVVLTMSREFQFLPTKTF